MWYNINMRISEPNQNYRAIKCVHILVMTILYIALIGVLVKVIGEPSRTAAAFLVDVFCYDEMLRVTYLYYERLRKQSKSKTKMKESRVGMTVKELKRYLDDVPDTAIVVIRNHTAPTILEKAWARHISAIAKPDGRYVPKTVDSKGDNVEVVVFD